MFGCHLIRVFGRSSTKKIVNNARFSETFSGLFLFIFLEICYWKVFS